MNSQSLSSLTFQWRIGLIIAIIISIGLYFIIRYKSPNILIANIPLLLIIIFVGIPLIIQIIIKAYHLNWSADVLAVIALVVAFYLHEYLTANIVILMLASGQLLEAYAIQKASFVLSELAKRIPSMAHRKINHVIEDIAVEDINISDLIIIYPHEVCPIDGVVIEGCGTMDESYLTGEPYKIDKTIGSAVISGAINGNSSILVRADKKTKDSRYSKIMHVMQEAQQHKPHLRRLCDQIGVVFTPIVLLFAGVTFYLTESSLRFLAVLVIATPCPLLIAIPITIVSAISIAAKYGIIIKDPTVLERLPTCSTAIFDKTGTLTCGEPELTEIIVTKEFTQQLKLETKEKSILKLLSLVASIEAYSRHPLSNAILKAAKQKNIPLLPATNISEPPGMGLSGIVASQEIKITNRKQLISDPNFTSKLKELKLLEYGLECIVLVNQKIAAILYFRDQPRVIGEKFIKHLRPKHQFKKFLLVSGDRASEVQYLAKLMGIQETYANQTPEQKLTIVKNENNKASTLFLGDGINDAPALTQATVGIAFGQSSGSITEVAGAVIMDSSLEKIDTLLHISIRMRRIALQSAIGGIICSIIGMGFASYGLITPVTSALLQELIDIVAIINSLRLIWEKIDIDIG